MTASVPAGRGSGGRRGAGAGPRPLQRCASPPGAAAPAWRRGKRGSPDRAAPSRKRHPAARRLSSATRGRMTSLACGMLDRPVQTLRAAGWLAVLAAALLAACAGQATPSLAEVRGDTDRYLGSTLRLTGSVVRFSDARWGAYYVLQDERANRVGLRGADDRTAGLVGQRVTTTGVLRFDESFGIYLDVQQIGLAIGA